MNLPIEPPYQVRFISQSDIAEIVNLYHLAKVPLSNQPKSAYKQMIWASDQFAKAHPEVSPTGAYKDLCGILGR